MSESSDTELSKLLPKHHGRYKGAKSSSVVSFHNINYALRVKENRKKVHKVILNNASGVFQPGLNAIMGPSGSGKTTLLEILSFRKNPDGMSGTVLIDGAPLEPNFNLTCGYVEQDDKIMGSMTVRENLTFCAGLRLPGHFTKEQRRVDTVITDLELEDCVDTKVGFADLSNSSRRISGGERKRTSVGLELMIRPTILFLDEPTTGLDATTAKSVIRLMARLSKRGYTIILSIHQPRYDIFRLFDTLHLLASGETVYHGPAGECLQYFNNIGFQCQKFENPADHFLDVIQQDAQISNDANQTSSLVSCYRHSQYHSELKTKLAPIYDSYSTKITDDVTLKKIEFPTSWLVQFWWLCWRTSSNLYRKPFVLGGQYFMPFFVVLLMGIVFYQLGDSATSGIQDRIGAFVLIILINMRIAAVSMVLFLEEKSIFRHENTNGYYHVSAYLLSKIIAYDIPQRLVPLTITTLIFYFMSGLRPGVEPFFMFYLNILLAANATGSMGFFIGINANTYSIAEYLFTVFFVLQALFAGFLINIKSMAAWLQNVEYLSVARYAINAASILEFKDREFCDDYPRNDTCSSGNEHLQIEGINYSVWGYWSTQLAMVIITLGFWLLCYVSLRRMPKYK